MKTPSKTVTRSGNKSRECNQFYAAAIPREAAPASRQPIPASAEFTIAEHLQVQRNIEERAHRFWFANGCRLNHALNDWLKAEKEVLAAFVKTRAPRRPAQPARRETNTKTGGTRCLAPALVPPLPVMAKLKSTPALHQGL